MLFRSGKNRVFLLTDSSCRCNPGYEFVERGVVQENINSKIDCQPIVYDRCSANQIRGPDGTCSKQDDCSSSCSGGEGTRSQSLGICQCKNVQKLDNVCNKGCRDSMPAIKLNEHGTFTIDRTSGSYDYGEVYINPNDLKGFNGKYLTCTKENGCNVKPVRISKTGVITSNYGLTDRKSVV